jgi:propionyl-CoA carboxylase alpha chain
MAHTITKLLVANRGEIARRVFRTARAMGMATVAVYRDADAGAPFVREADEAVHLPGNTPAETYLRGDLVVDAARRSGADAVHPGYGFLSENAEFARQVEAAGLIWVGPPADAIETMGSKLAAKELMQKAGVPTLPWAVDPSDAETVGYPLLVKASAGGGGRGMRIVRNPTGLDDAVDGARREAGSAFGDDTVFLERYLDAPRHIEIQVFADTHGNVVSLFDRECSIQRRHQKIVEESPSPAVDDSLRDHMGAAAVAAAQAVGYVGAGTVEFVLATEGSGAGKEFAFLEMNTRLQVEHPVTELVTGLDLVRLQLLVAMGEPLPAEALSPRIDGHAIEVRLYAEDAANDFLPATGTLRAFDVPRSMVRVDSGFESGSVVSPYYDAMLAKVIAHAPSRREAAATLESALRRSRMHGVITNRDLLVAVLRSAEFLSGHTDTAFLDRNPPADLARSPLDDGGRRAHALAAALAVQARNRAATRVQAQLPSGWRNNPSQPQSLVLRDAAGDELTVSYALGRGGLRATVDDTAVEAVVHTVTAATADLAIDGVRRTYTVALGLDVVDVDSPLGSSSYTIVPRFPDHRADAVAGSLVAPMPGSVVRVLVEVGTTVVPGQALVVLEAMKMEHTVSAPAEGAVTDVRVIAGQQVEAGAVLVVVAEEQDTHED